MRLQYPPDLKLILMPCTGRVDILHLLKAFEAGADAVVVVGCLEGECHYLMGNIRARKRVTKVKKDLEAMGLEPERIEMFNLSSSEGPRFAAIAREMVERAYKLGPTNLRIMRTMCTGRVDPMYVMKALEKDNDGVFVFG